MISSLRIGIFLSLIACSCVLSRASGLSYAGAESISPDFWNFSADHSGNTTGHDEHRTGHYFLESHDLSGHGSKQGNSPARHEGFGDGDSPGRFDHHDDVRFGFRHGTDNGWFGNHHVSNSNDGHHRSEWHWDNHLPDPIDCDPPTAIPEPSQFAAWLGVATLGLCLVRSGAWGRLVARLHSHR